MSKRLRLRAVDQDDLQVMAACLQDALVPLREMAFMVDDRCFMAAFHRFQWERFEPKDAAGKDRAEPLMACQSVLRVDHVQEVKYRGLDPEMDAVKLELLTMLAEPIDDHGVDLVLLFAGDVAIKLKVSELSLTLDDFGDPWASGLAPKHNLSDMPPSPGTSSASKTSSGNS